jgi:hypothetical protein
LDARERVFDPEETIRAAIDARASRIWTAIPGIVQSFNRAHNTVEVQPTINGRVRQIDGTWLRVQMPKVVDVPVVWPGGGGVTLVFDITAGDECLLHFSARCIDAWWSQGWVSAVTGDKGADGGPVNPANDPPEYRMHNLSDGFASVGVRSLVRAFAIDPGVCRLRTDDDATYFEFNPTAKTFKAVFSGGINLNGVTIDSAGNVISPATVTGTTQVVAGSGGSAVHLTTHTHGGVQTGSGVSGAPTAGS